MRWMGLVEEIGLVDEMGVVGTMEPVDLRRHGSWDAL